MKSRHNAQGPQVRSRPEVDLRASRSRRPTFHCGDEVRPAVGVCGQNLVEPLQFGASAVVLLGSGAERPRSRSRSGGGSDSCRRREKYLLGQTPEVEVGGDVLLGQRLEQVSGEAAQQTAGLGFCRPADTVTEYQDLDLVRTRSLALSRHAVPRVQPPARRPPVSTWSGSCWDRRWYLL